MWTDDPLADFEMHEVEQERRLEQMPICSQCDEHIQDETAYYINGEWICKDCMTSFEKEVLPEW